MFIQFLENKSTTPGIPGRFVLISGSVREMDKIITTIMNNSTEPKKDAEDCLLHNVVRGKGS